MIGLRLAFSITFALVGLFSPVAAEAQQAAKIARIGFLTDNLAGNRSVSTRMRHFWTEFSVQLVA